MVDFGMLRTHIAPRRDSPEGPIVGLLLLSSLCTLVPAFLTRVLFDRVIPDHRSELLGPVLAAMLVTGALGLLARTGAERCLASAARLGRHRYRSRLAGRLDRMPLAWFDRHGPGAVVRHYEDAAVLGDLRPAYLRSVVGSTLALLVLLPPMFLLQPMLGFCRVAAALPSLAAGTAFLRRDLECERRLWAARRVFSTDLVQGVRGAAVLKTHRGGRGPVQRIRGRLWTLGSLEEERRVLGIRWDAVAQGTVRLGAALTLILAVRLVLAGRLSFGSYIAFSIVAGRAMAVLGDLLGGLRRILRARNAAERHRSLDAAEGDDGAPSVCLIRNPTGDTGLEIHSVTFGYGSADPLLKDFSLTVRPGERVLVSGASGAGKSTLFGLILGFHQPWLGTIRWSGRPLPGTPAMRRRRIVGAVLQSPAFFDGTVRENLCLFGPPPADRVLWSALEAAAAEDVVCALPGGLDARLEGEGSGLSGGQRQRLAIARLLLRPAPLILLDEPTNALDSESAARVRRSLSRACSDRTVLVVAHGEPTPLPVHRRIAVVNGGVRDEG